MGGVYLICERFSYYKTHRISLLEKLEELYAACGYCLNTLHSYEYEGSRGFARMQKLRSGIAEFANRKAVRCLDYKEGVEGVPPFGGVPPDFP